MTHKYTHLELKKEVKCIAGYYSPDKELRLQHKGREVLAVVGYSCIDSSCCGASNWSYAIVPGYIVKWQSQKNKEGLPVSEVEPVTDSATRAEIIQLLKRTENISSLEFW